LEARTFTLTTKLARASVKRERTLVTCVCW